MKKLAVVMAAMLAFSVVGANALYYQVGADSAVTGPALSDPGLVIEYMFDADLVGRSFNLENGQHETFEFFDIWTDEDSIDWEKGGDLWPKEIFATLDFAIPDAAGTVGGVTFAGVLGGGYVEWDNPETVTVVGDRQFLISLSNEAFNFNWLGLEPGKGNGATVQATVCQVWGNDGNVNPQGVPDGGATLAFLGLALAGLGIFRRK